MIDYLHQFKDKDGQKCCILLDKKGYPHIEKVMYLVANSFNLPNPNNLKCLRHIDGNKENNSLTNLEWAEFED